MAGMCAVHEKDILLPSLPRCVFSEAGFCHKVVKVMILEELTRSVSYKIFNPLLGNVNESDPILHVKFAPSGAYRLDGLFLDGVQVYCNLPVPFWQFALTVH